jgi:hypothetical protein
MALLLNIYWLAEEWTLLLHSVKPTASVEKYAA